MNKNLNKICCKKNRDKNEKYIATQNSERGLSRDKRIDSEARSVAPIFIGINSTERSASESGEKFCGIFTNFLSL